MDLIIDNEFRDLIPPPSDDEKKQLEENILRDGIQDPLKVWNGILIDGHNRYEIAQAHGLEFKTVEMHFDSRDDVIIWIIKNQFGRRNLSAYDRSILALKLKPVIAAKAKEQQGERTDLLQKSAESSKPMSRILAKVQKKKRQPPHRFKNQCQRQHENKRRIIKLQKRREFHMTPLQKLKKSKLK